MFFLHSLLFSRRNTRASNAPLFSRMRVFAWAAKTGQTDRQTDRQTDTGACLKLLNASLEFFPSQESVRALYAAYKALT